MIRAVFVLLTVVVIFTGAETQDPTAISVDRFIDPNGSNFVTNPNPPFVVQPNQCTNAALPCATLDWAVDQADPGDTIIASCGDYVAEETAELNKNLTIRSDNRCAVFSAPGKRVINISNSAAVTLISLQVSGGDAGSGNGGGIRVRSGSSLILEDVLVKNNEAESGGGILAGGALTIKDSEVLENDAANMGGGIRVGSNGSLTMINSEVRLNLAGGQGGGIHSSGQTIISENSAVSFNNSLGSGAGIAADDGTLAISDSIVNTNFTAITPGPGGFINGGGGLHISGADVLIERSFIVVNKADRGGGIDVSSGELRIESSTISENVAARAGGGLANFAETTAHNSTFSGNKAGVDDEPGEGGAFYNWGSSSMLILASVTTAFNEAGSGGGLYNTSFAVVGLANVIFAQHLFSKDCVNTQNGLFVIRSDYLSEDGTCPGALVLPAGLEPLADNGGPTETHMPGKLSEAVDIGDPAICAELGNVDQRMVSRVNMDGNGDPADGNPCDMGAVERDASPLPPVPFSIYIPLVSSDLRSNTTSQ
jgi:predicted outer membrane repeat protein